MLTFFVAIATIILILLFLGAMEQGEFSFAFVLFIVASATGYAFYARITAPEPPPTAEQAEATAKRKAAIEEAKIPKIFSSTSDGCQVYKFVDNGYNHYFTRCELKVVTDSTYRSGKSTKVESIQTNQEQAK